MTRRAESVRGDGRVAADAVDDRGHDRLRRRVHRLPDARLRRQRKLGRARPLSLR